jgi:hypothetical protein
LSRRRPPAGVTGEQVVPEDECQRGQAGEPAPEAVEEIRLPTIMPVSEVAAWVGHGQGREALA